MPWADSLHPAVVEGKSTCLLQRIGMTKTMLVYLYAVLLVALLYGIVLFLDHRECTEQHGISIWRGDGTLDCIATPRRQP